MPYKASQAKRFSKKATGKKARQWVHVYDSARARGDSEGTAIRKASGTIKRGARKDRRR